MADSLGRDDSSVGHLTAEVPSVFTGLHRGDADSVTTRRERPDETPYRTEAFIATASASRPDSSRTPSPTGTLTACRVAESRRHRDVRRARAHPLGPGNRLGRVGPGNRLGRADVHVGTASAREARGR